MTVLEWCVSIGCLLYVVVVSAFILWAADSRP